jgi:predicted small secreted protein
MLEKWIYGPGAVASVLSLPACKPIQGAGRDIERSGQAIQDEAKDAKQRM